MISGVAPMLNTWVKPLTGSYGLFSMAKGEIDIGEELASTSR